MVNKVGKLETLSKEIGPKILKSAIGLTSSSGLVPVTASAMCKDMIIHQKI